MGATVNVPPYQLRHWDYEDKVCYIYGGGGGNKYTLISLFIKKIIIKMFTRPSSFKIVYLPVYSINYWISTIAKIPSTEQDGGFNVMSMGRNGSSLAWMTTKII